MPNARRPISEYLIGRQHSPAVRERIARLNPDGQREGELPRGWHPHRRISELMTGMIRPREFIRKFGRQTYRAIPRDRLFHQGHRKAVPYTYIKEAGLNG